MIKIMAINIYDKKNDNKIMIIIMKIRMFIMVIYIFAIVNNSLASYNTSN